MQTAVHSIRLRALVLPCAAVVAVLAFSGPAVAATAPSPMSPSPTVNPAPAGSTQIIMRDGGVCDPIRHMGC
jgi:hypothetical protein